MLTPAEVDSLAREILSEIITKVVPWGVLLEVRQTDDGDLVPVYAGATTEGYARNNRA